MNRESKNTLDELYEVIASRRDASPESSYTASLMHKGIDKILKKLGEEATEVVIAGKGGKREEIIYETADLFYHALVLLSYKEIKLSEIYEELDRRSGISGITEKASRSDNHGN